MRDVQEALEHDTLTAARQLAACGHPARAYDMALTLQEFAGNGTAQAEQADCLADCCLKMARYEQGIGHCRQAATIWESLGDTTRQAQATALMAELMADLGVPDAGAAAQRALQLAERSGNASALARAHMTMGLVLCITREPEQALPFAERAVTISRQAGLDFPVALINLAEAVLWCGLQAGANGAADRVAPAVARAIDLSREALAAARANGDGWLARLALHNIAEYSMYVDDIATATAAMAEVPGTPGQPTTRCQSHHLTIQAKLLMAQGRLEQAKACLETCWDLLQDADYLEMEVGCLRDLTDVLEKMGRFEEALAAHRRFHARHLRMASEQTKRLARLAAHEAELRALREAAGRANSLAASLVRSNAELTRETERLLRTNLEDTLTGLPNRRRLEMALSELATSPTPFACAMLDVDHFKQVNDRYSHAVGDAVLRKIGAIFSHLCRQDDLVARFGGEEFALLIYSADSSLPLTMCERLRQAIEQTDWASIQPSLSIKISAGFALSGEAAHPDLVLKLADERLYEAKRGGRNRVVGP